MSNKLPEDPKALLAEALAAKFGTCATWRHHPTSPCQVTALVGRDSELRVVARCADNDDAQFIAKIGGSGGLFGRLVDALERVLQEETPSALAAERANYLRLRERQYTLERRAESAEARCEELRADIEPLQARLRMAEVRVNELHEKLEAAAERETRLLARRAVRCDGGRGSACYLSLDGNPCPNCGGSGAVIVEGDEGAGKKVAAFAFLTEGVVHPPADLKCHCGMVAEAIYKFADGWFPLCHEHRGT